MTGPAGSGPTPRTVVGVAGTATGVGKTWVTARLVERLWARGTSASARKPVQSFDPDDTDPTDADVLAAAAGEEPFAICPPHRWYPLAMAPPMAAAALDCPAPTIADLVNELNWPDHPVEVGFVETAGGTRSPVADDGDCADLLRAVGAHRVVLVADAGLGVIDAVRSAVDAVADVGPTIVFLNRFEPADELHRRNEDWLRNRDGLEIVTELDHLVEQLPHR